MLEVKEIDLSVTKGWIVSNHDNSFIKMTGHELALKQMKKGDCGDFRSHTNTDEYIYVINGNLKITIIEFENKKKIYNIKSGCLINIRKKTIHTWEAVSDTLCVVVKIGNIIDDKIKEIING